MKGYLICLWVAGVLLFAAQPNIDSEDWQDRGAAFQQLTIENPVTVSTQQKLRRLLDRENQVVQSSLKASNGTEGVSVTLGEGYSEYYSSLLSSVASIAKAGYGGAVATVAAGAYNPDSAVGGILIDKWQISLPVFLQYSQDSGGLRQPRAFEMIGRIVRAHRHEIDEAQMKDVQLRLTEALRSAQASVRVAGIRANALAGMTSLIPDIKRLANEDPLKVPSGTHMRYPVRDEAKRALLRLEQH